MESREYPRLLICTKHQGREHSHPQARDACPQAHLSGRIIRVPSTPGPPSGHTSGTRMLASSGVLWPSVCGPGLAPPASVSSRWLSQQLVEGPGAGGGGRAGLGGTGVLLAAFIPLCLADCTALQAGRRWPQGPGCGWKPFKGPSVKCKIGRGAPHGPHGAQPDLKHPGRTSEPRCLWDTEHWRRTVRAER